MGIRKPLAWLQWVVLLPVALGSGLLAKMIVGTDALYFWPLVEGTDGQSVEGPIYRTDDQAAVPRPEPTKNSRSRSR